MVSKRLKRANSPNNLKLVNELGKINPSFFFLLFTYFRLHVIINYKLNITYSKGANY
jgi:hypothetical protein